MIEIIDNNVEVVDKPSNNKSVTFVQTLNVTYEQEEDELVGETKRDRIERIYHEYARKEGYESIEERYIHKKFQLANMSELDKSDEIMLKLLNTIASDMGFTTMSFVSNSGSNLRTLTPQQMLKG